MNKNPLNLKVRKKIGNTAKGFALVVTTAILLAVPNFTAFASDNLTDRQSNGTNITVVVPTQAERPQAAPEPKPVLPILYPVAVSENREFNRREIIRVYELAEHENPDHIPREPFEREGYYYELADIFKSDMLSFDSREHVETITVNTTTNNLDAVLKLLSQTIEHQADDGYMGILTLDVSTIKIEQAGTRTSHSTQRKTREYPHLSSSDLSLVPKTITDGGRTYHLENVDWKTASTEAIDYTQLAQTYTAVATYSAQVSSTSVTGYNTTAEYKGVISKTSQGKTRYTANYISIPIVSPILNRETVTSSTETEATETTEDDMETDTDVEANEETTVDDENGEVIPENSSNGISPIILVILLVIVAVIAYFAGKLGKKFISKMKKPTVMMLVVGVLFGTLAAPQSVYASSLSSLPSYGFGNINAGSTEYFYDSANDGGSTNSNDGYHFTALSGQLSGNGFRANAYHMELGASGFNGSQYGYADGQLIGKLTVEKLKRTINVYEGESLSSMDKGGGRFSFTGTNTGNTAIIGHNRGRSNGYFIFVKDLQQGDIVRLEMNGVTKRYTVSYLYTVSETDTSPLGQFGDSRLTLVTCVENVKNMRCIAVLFETGS